MQAQAMEGAPIANSSLMNPGPYALKSIFTQYDHYGNPLPNEAQENANY